MTHDTASTPLRQSPGPSAGSFLRAHAPPPSPNQPLALYVHIPFCFHKCHYCDFYSIVDKRDRQDPFTDRLIHELDALGPLAVTGPSPSGSPGRLHSIFVGGGTPTLLRPDLWQRLLEALHRNFDLTAQPEFTVECNPETATAELMDVLVAGGVNRVSIGAQSFNPRHLKALERWHDPANVARALELAQAAGIKRASVDLIYAIPEQTPEEWSQDLATALTLPIDHVSAYALTYEPGTAMTARLQRGDFEPAPDELEAELTWLTLKTMRAHGFDRYEVSNYAKPGGECQHNLAYWRQHDWLAAGPSASGHLAGRRWKNVPRLDDYLAFNDAGFAPVLDHESPDAQRNLAELIMTGVRLREGLDVESITAQAARFDSASPTRLRHMADVHRAEGWLQPQTDRWVLTDAGYLFADRVAGDLMGCLDD